MRIPYRLYFFSLICIHFVYGMVFLGILSTVPKYVYLWNIAVQVGLCCFLMYRYHPFRTSYDFEPIDAKLVFGSALLLLVNVISLPLLFRTISQRIREKTIQIDIL